MRSRCLLSWLLLLTIAPVFAAPAADWPTYQHDLEHTGRSTAVINASQLTLSWEAPEGYATPQIVGDTVYSTKWQGGFAGNRSGGTNWATYITAFDLASGAVKWSHFDNYLFSTQAAVGGGLVVFHGGMMAPASSPPTPGANQLVVLDAATGALRYKVPVPGDRTPGMMPLLVPNPADGTVMAYYATGDMVSGVRLGPSSGSVVWTQMGQFGGRSIPTLVGSSIVVAGPCQFYAFDQMSGAPNHFHQGSCHGGGGTTVVYDSGRQHIYVLEAANAPGTISSEQALTAFHYAGNAQIDFLWQRVGRGIGRGSVALGSSGNVYVTDYGLLLELNPGTGATIRSAPGTFQSQVTPAITADLFWASSGDGSTVVHDLETLQPRRTFSGGNDSSSMHSSVGAFADGYFVMSRGDNVFSKGFAVWAGPTAQPLNIATRVRVEPGEKQMIGGFIISGPEPKHVLIRALGSTLQQSGLSDTLPDPAIDLRDSTGINMKTNDNWKDTQAAEIAGTGLAPTFDSEAAVVVALDPGAYTAVVHDATGGSGVGLVEVYDLSATTEGKLANISTRGHIDTGDNVMIGGFILGNGARPAQIVVRAIGPSLAQRGVNGSLADPVLDLRDANGELIRRNDNWRDSQETEIAATGLAPESNAEAAIVANLPPSPYTAVVSGRNGGTGIGLVEVYHVR